LLFSNGDNWPGDPPGWRGCTAQDTIAVKLLRSIANAFSSQGKAENVYKRGMQKAKAEDLPGAIADYTLVIESKDAPPDIRAMAYFNRALAYSKQDRDDVAVVDLKAVVSLPKSPPNIVSAAKEKLARWEKRRLRG
jgi:hypothetical protein